MVETRSGKISLVDLIALVVIALVLGCMVLPSTRYAREASKRSGCQNNLRQLCLAAINFETQTQKLPANRQYRSSPNGPATMGWIYDLLPFLEQQTTYDRLKRNPLDLSANEARIVILQCPQDSTLYRPTDISYAVNSGCPNNLEDNFDVPPNGVSDDLTGPPPAARASMANCKDGSGQTFLYVENYNAQRWNEERFHHPEHSREYFNAVHWLPVNEKSLGLVFQAGPRTAKNQLWPINEGDPREWGPEFARPSSEHPGGFQAVFVGGNTRYLSEAIDYAVYAQLLSSHGARTLDPRDQTPKKSASIRAWQTKPLAPQQYE
jgi:hypothetical protein